MRTATKAILCAVGLGAPFWILDSIVDSVIFNKGPIVQQLLAPEGHTILTRAMIISVLVLGGITFHKRKRLEKKLLETNNYLENLIDNANDVIYTQDLDGNLTFINRRAEDIVGYVRSDWLGKTTAAHLHPDDLLKVRENLEKLANGEAVSGELRFVAQNGDIITLSIHEVPIYINGKVTGLFGIARDITDHKRALEALIKSEERYRLHFEYVGDVIYSVDREFRITDVSPSVKAVTGYSPEEIVGQSIGADMGILAPEYIGKGVSRTAKILAGDQIGPTEYEFIMKDGSRKFGEVWGAPLFKDGRIVGVINVARDITERKRAERTLHNYQEQLRSLASELSLAEERERRRIATELHDYISQGLLVSNLKIGKVIESIPASDVADSLNEAQELIEQTIRDVRSLTFELSPPILYMIGFEAAVEWLVEQTRERHGIKAILKNDGQSKPLEEDIRVLLFQTVRELLVNVAKHSKARSAEVSICRNGDNITITVEDDGVGFDGSRIGSCWNSTDGFGLFSIRERLNHLGGSFEIRSHPGKGTSVVITAPLKPTENRT